MMIKSRKSSPGRKRIWLLIGTLLILLGSGVAWYFWGSLSTSATVLAQQQVYTARVTRSSGRDSAKGTGTLTTAQTENLSFKSDGQLAELNVRLGDKVKTGDVLGRLGNMTRLEASVASAEVKALQAQQALDKLYQQAQLNAAQAYSDWLTAKETYDKALAAEQRMNWSRCSKEINTRYAELLRRAAENLEQKKLSPNVDEFKEALNNYETAYANYNYCIAYTADEKTKATATREVAETKLKNAEAKYQTLKKSAGIDPDDLTLAEANLKAAKAQLDLAKENLAGGTLTATIDGTVVAVNYKQGASVEAGDTIVTLADLDHLYLTVNIYETDFAKMVVGTPAEVVFDALKGKVYTGKVTLVQPQITTSGQYRFVKGMVELDNPSSSSGPAPLLGMSATVEIITKEVKNALFIPVEALRSLGNNEYAVFVVSNDGTMRLRTVTIGWKDKNQVEITSGLSEGETVSTGIASTSTK